MLRGRAGDALGVALPRSVLIPREAAALLVALVACRGDRTDTPPDAARPSPLGVAPAASHPQIGARPPRPPVDEAALALAASATVRREPPSTFIVDAAARRALCDNRDGAFRQLRVLPESPDGGAAGRGPWSGMRLFGVRAEQLAGRLGLVNGDLLLGVDDMPLDSQAAIDPITEHLCAAPTVTLHVAARPSRDAGPVDLVWRFVPD